MAVPNHIDGNAKRKMKLKKPLNKILSATIAVSFVVTFVFVLVELDISDPSTAIHAFYLFEPINIVGGIIGLLFEDLYNSKRELLGLDRARGGGLVVFALSWLWVFGRVYEYLSGDESS